MICDILKFFSQNIRKNKLIVNTILEIQFSYNIIFLQEPLWPIIRSIPNSNSYKEELLISIPHHPISLPSPDLPPISLTLQES